MAQHTCRDIATLSLKKLGVLRAGGQPTSADAEDARASLQSFYNECVAQGTFGRIQNINLSRAAASPVTAGLNQHINVTTDDAVTIDLPATVAWNHWWTWMPGRDYGWGKTVPLGTDAGNVMPRDKSVISVTYQASAPTAAVRAVYLYDGTIQRWMRIDQIALSDEAPLSARGLDGLASILAIRLIDLFGDALASAATVRSANSFKLALVSRHGEGDCEDGYA